MNKNLKLLCILLVLPCLAVWAMDFGLNLDQSGGYGGYGEYSHPDYKASLIPRFSALFGDSGELYISAGMNAEYTERVEYIEYEQNVEKNWTFVPELLRTEFTWALDNGEFRVGRMHYSDPLGIIALGLFDGARFSYETGLGTFSLGAWYTGLLYKSRANIAMTVDEFNDIIADVDLSDFANSYFAPSRLAAALDWENQSLGGGSLRANLSLLGQFDLSGADKLLNTQYLTAKLSLPVQAFLFDLGGSLGLAQDDGNNETSFAAQLRAAWTIPGAIPSQLSLTGLYTSGESGGLGAFIPLTTVSQGSLLGAKPSGISVISLDFITRLHRTFSLSLSSAYFIRNGMDTFIDYPADMHFDGTKREGNLLGNEFFGRLYWMPISDLAMNVGGGIFLPSMGNLTPEPDYNLWRIEFGLTLSLF